MPDKLTARHFDVDSYDYVAAEFSRRVHNRESDFEIYADTGYQRHYGEPLLAALVHELLTDRSGVVRILVKDFGLTAYYDRAADRRDIQARILTACLSFSGFEGVEPIATKWLFYP